MTKSGMTPFHPVRFLRHPTTTPVIPDVIRDPDKVSCNPCPENRIDAGKYQRRIKFASSSNRSVWPCYPEDYPHYY